MQFIELKSVISTGQTVTKNHFGGNAIFRKNTENGQPNEGFQKATSLLDIEISRYPAGEPDVAYKSGLISNGELPDHLKNYLDVARAEGEKVVIVTPTHAAYRSADELYEFITILIEEYGNVVHAFEIGNEYWNHQTETSYGKVADESLIAINRALTETGHDAPIWVQMASAGGQASEFHINKTDGGWVSRNIDANYAILDQLSTEARSLVDGVVEHYYFRNPNQFLSQENTNDQLIGLDRDIWEQELGRGLSLNITEWNIRTSNLDQLGIRAGSAIATQFSYLMQLKVDEAYVWPPQHNTTNDLAGSGDVVVDPETGIVKNSVAGAVFDLMSSSLVGLEYIHSTMNIESSKFLHTVYASDAKVVVYLSSRSHDIENIQFSLGEQFPNLQLKSALQVGYDKSTSDGQHWSPSEQKFVSSQYVMLDNEKYFINEHDVHADIKNIDINSFPDADVVELALNPYEIVELSYNLVNVQYGDSQADRVNGGIGADRIETLGGNDVVETGSGNDTVYGGKGDDFVNSGDHADVVFGEAGNDSIRGWGGSDTLFGGEGNDNIEGWYGNDLIAGGSGDDHLSGGFGDDTLTDGIGVDWLEGGDGDDFFELNSQSVFGLEDFAVNESSHIQVGTNEVVSIEGLLRYETIVLGGYGYDQVSLSSKSDAFFLHDTISQFFQPLLFGVDGVKSIARFSGIECILAGSGDDVVDLSSSVHSLLGDNISIHGEDGDDYLWGSDANETIFGGEGDDTIFGGEGRNSLIGGYGADTFAFTASSLNTIIEDFNPATGDRIAIYETDYFYFLGYEISRSQLLVNTSLGDLLINLDEDIEYDSVEDYLASQVFLDFH